MTNGEERTRGKRPGIMSRLFFNTTIEQLCLQKDHLAAAHTFAELGIST